LLIISAKIDIYI